MEKNKIDKIIDEELGHFDESDLSLIKDEDTKDWLSTHVNKAWTGVKNIGKAVTRETLETYAAAKILIKLTHDSENVTDEEIEFMKDQSVDLVKALTIIGLQAVPGSSAAIIALEVLAKKKGFTLFPKEQVIPETKD